MYSALGKDEFITGSKDHKHRLDTRQKWIAAAEVERADDDEEEEEEEAEKERLERETKQLQSQLRRQNAQQHWHMTSRNGRRHHSSVR